MRASSRIWGSIAGGVALVLAGAVQASPYYWIGTGNWSDTNNWASSAGGGGGAYNAAPGASDDVYFSGGGGASTIESSYSIRSLTVSGFAAGLTFVNDAAGNLAISGDFSLGSGCTLTIPRSSTLGNGTGRVITVGGDAVIDGTINGDYKGFNPGSGPGAGTYNQRGASHGGRGGKTGLAPYGSLTEPTSLGSGGGNSSASYGGGAIKIAVTSNLTVNGAITVRGAVDHDAASGGSIWLVSSNFAGTGTLDASGGNCSYYSSNQNHPGGGGGRIALHYTNSTFSGFVTVSGGWGGWTDYPGQPGTLWEPQRFDGVSDVTITGGYQYFFPAGSTQNWNSLSLVNVDKAGQVFFHNGTLNIGNLLVSNATLRVDLRTNGTAAARNFDLDGLSVSGSITVASPSSTVRDRSYLYLPAQGDYSLSGNLALGLNSWIWALSDTSAVNPASGGTAGNPHGAGLSIACANARLDGTVNGDYLGFGTHEGPGAGLYNGYGASHGGKGSRGAATAVKPPYGSLTQPTALGSGGGNTGSGGSAVKIAAANDLALDGAITVRGSDAHEGSSGGSIWVMAQNFSGSGALVADGGNSSSLVYGYGAGAGGRIAIQATNTTFTGSVSAAAGLGVYYAQPGTLWQPGRFASPGDVTMTTGFQYAFEPGATQVFSRLTIANPTKGGAVCFRGGHLVIGDLLVSNANLRVDVTTNGATEVFDLESLSITGSITVAAAGTAVGDVGSLYLPSEGIYDLAGSLVCRSNSFIYALSDTNAVNADSGGTAVTPHGAGLTLTAADAAIDGTISGYGLGFPAGKGPGAGLYNQYGASYGGRGGRSSKPTYGALSRPSALGSGSGAGGSTGPGGGAVKLVTAGDLVVNGTIDVRAPAAYSAGAGGSIWLKAGALSGSGSLLAGGGNGSSGTHSGGGGGRVAFECVANTFSGSLAAQGGTWGTPPAATGTWFNCALPLDDRGITLQSDYAVASHANGVSVSRTVTQWTPSDLKWDESSSEWASGAALSNYVAYTVNGLDAGATYSVFNNGALFTNVSADPAGNAGPFYVVLTGAVHTVYMDRVPAGTLVLVR